jgi:16S rRNA (adenine1518-N6/adenine1519-N6)-dimethyltransferase
MHTKQKIQQLLASQGLNPNKRLGQHFLIDLNLIRLLIENARIHSNDTVLEVGPGTGSLSIAIAERAGSLIAVEFDDALAQIAAAELQKYPNAKVINADILENKSTICRQAVEEIQQSKQNLNGRCLLVANLPYNVSTPVLMNLILHEPAVDAMYVTIQKEVAQRMAAAPSTEHYGTLSIVLEALGSVKLIRKLGKEVFWPQPQVESAMVSFICENKKAAQIQNLETFRQVVSLFMGHRRKMLKSCTKFAAGKLEKISKWQEVFEEAFVDPHKRPEEITPKGYINIANICARLTEKT